MRNNHIVHVIIYIVLQVQWLIFCPSKKLSLVGESCDNFINLRGMHIKMQLNTYIHVIGCNIVDEHNRKPLPITLPGAWISFIGEYILSN